MFFWSHKCVQTPYTSYEIKETLRVRENKATVTAFDYCRYQDPDTGRFNFDKLKSLNSETRWVEMMDCEPYDNRLPGTCPYTFEQYDIVLPVFNGRAKDTLQEQEEEEARLKSLEMKRRLEDIAERARAREETLKRENEIRNLRYEELKRQNEHRIKALAAKRKPNGMLEQQLKCLYEEY